MSQRSPTRLVSSLDRGGLERLAVHYLGRFATTRARLALYLARKVHERGWLPEDEDARPAIAEIVERCAANGYVDDAVFAGARSASLIRKGMGPRRVMQSLQAAGIDRDLAVTFVPDEDEALGAAEQFARRRRFGRFGTHDLDPSLARRQMAAMVRAGHSYSHAHRFLRPPSESDT